MDTNQTTPSATTGWIPQGIPTGVFVANNQTPVSNTTSPQPTTDAAVAPVSLQEKPLDRRFVSLTKFLAKIFGQPDPITWAPNPASKLLQKAESISEKARWAANQVAEKAQNVADKTVTTVTHVTEKIQEVIPPPAQQPTTPVEPMTIDQLQQPK